MSVLVNSVVALPLHIHCLLELLYWILVILASLLGFVFVWCLLDMIVVLLRVLFWFAAGGWLLFGLAFELGCFLFWGGYIVGMFAWWFCGCWWLCWFCVLSLCCWCFVIIVLVVLC